MTDATPARRATSTHRAGRVLVLVSLMLSMLLAGCATKEEQVNDDFQTLAARGSDERAEQRYLTLLTEIQGVLSEFNPRIVWPAEGPTKDGTSMCGDDFNVPGQTSSTYGSSGKGEISDADWPTAAAKVKQIAAPQGFTIEAMTLERPGQHEYVMKDAEGASLEIGGGNTVISIFGSCHLPQAVLDAGLSASSSVSR